MTTSLNDTEIHARDVIVQVFKNELIQDLLGGRWAAIVRQHPSGSVTAQTGFVISVTHRMVVLKWQSEKTTTIPLEEILQVQHPPCPAFSDFDEEEGSSR